MEVVKGREHDGYAVKIGGLRVKGNLRCQNLAEIPSFVSKLVYVCVVT
jgi:hypothetical protein